MRTINEIKSDFRKPDADFAELMDELFNTVARDIPFSRFEEICHAERDGRCVVLPCKVGDAIYPIDVDRDLAKPPFRITGFRFLGFDCEGWIEVGCLKYKFPDLGKTVFLTRESAEAALKGEQHES